MIINKKLILLSFLNIKPINSSKPSKMKDLKQYITIENISLASSTIGLISGIIKHIRNLIIAAAIIGSGIGLYKTYKYLKNDKSNDDNKSNNVDDANKDNKNVDESNKDNKNVDKSNDKNKSDNNNETKKD